MRRTTRAVLAEVWEDQGAGGKFAFGLCENFHKEELARFKSQNLVIGQLDSPGP